jgi:hypothetical protein
VIAPPLPHGFQISPAGLAAILDRVAHRGSA